LNKNFQLLIIKRKKEYGGLEGLSPFLLKKERKEKWSGTAGLWLHYAL
jgi:hypothetical protein